MTPETFLDGRVTLHPGDCLDVLATLPPDTFHACLTDPPYHFGSIIKRWSKTGGGDRAESRVGAFARHSRGFMGSTWDAPAELPERMIDADFGNWLAGFIDGEGCFSVHKKTVNDCETYDCQFTITLRDDDKPILLEIQRALGGIGTIADRPARENSGNGKPQVRYCISSQADCQHLRGVLSVYPLRAKKARDFDIWSAALDQWVAHEPKSSWEDVAYFRDALMAVKKYGSLYSPSQLFHYRWARAVVRVLKPGAHLVAFGAPKNEHRLTCAIEDAGFEIRDKLMWLFGVGFPKSHDAKKAMGKADDVDLFREHLERAAAKWEGWGTALKPAYEPIILARKPMAGTVQENLREHGTGGINVDACRVPGEDATGGAYTVKRRKPGAEMSRTGGNYRPEDRDVLFHGETKPGRWPANLLHDGSDEVVELFPDSAGAQGVVRGTEPSAPFQDIYNRKSYRSPEVREPRGDSGTAARFFYCTKATKAERAGSKHPTVKPVSPLRYFARLITPPGGLILDPFAGTGTTAQAALLEGFRATLIEREPKYQDDIRRRLQQATAEAAE